MPKNSQSAKVQAVDTSSAKVTKPRRSAQLKRLLRIDASPQAAAAEAHLHYVNDGTPGITRHPTKEDKVFTYRHPDGKLVRDLATLDRIRKLAIPPAYRDVWICTDPDGHLQATGKDARGRRQSALA
jgi:DNA topoisomerase-1